jgi:hypothetical protein
VLLPRGYAGFAAANRGRRESRDSDVSARGGLTPTVRLARGGKARRFDAGLLPARGGSGQPAPSPSPGAPAPTPEPEPQPQPPGPPFQIAGLVWRDYGDGIRQTDELARREGTVELWTADRSTMLASTTTNGFGGWTLTVPGGVAYRVRVIENGSYKSFAPKRQGSDPTRDSDFNWAGADKGFTDVIPADAGSMHFDAAAMTPVNIGNLVWRDLNANGIQDAGESGVANVTVELWDATRTELLDSVVSDASGNYFVKAPCGGQWYRIRVVPPIGAGFAPKDQGGNDQLDSDIHVAGPEAGWTDVVPIASNVISTTIWDAGLVPAP